MALTGDFSLETIVTGFVCRTCIKIKDYTLNFICCRFPGLQDSMKTFLSTEMEKVMREEKFLKEEPERLESALRRCKKLTGTLVTLKR